MGEDAISLIIGAEASDSRPSSFFSQGIVTLLFFPILLGLSYAADQGKFDCSTDIQP